MNSGSTGHTWKKQRTDPMICAKCEGVKPLAEFPATGRTCKKCFSGITGQWARDHIDRKRELTRTGMAKHRCQVKQPEARDPNQIRDILHMKYSLHLKNSEIARRRGVSRQSISQTLISFENYLKSLTPQK